MRSDFHQILLIIAGILVTALFGVFFYREIFPEYKIYQNDYIALEAFRSTYTHQPAADFQKGIKQIVIEREDKGPSFVDRCTSCHVALQIPYFSKTKIAYDLNGEIVRQSNGNPLLVANDEYIWQKLDEAIANLKDTQVIEQLKKTGENAEVDRRIKLAESYESLKVAHVGEQVYDVTKVLSMHPLMGNETRPFEFHPIEDYGCTTCHSGNGRGLVTDKAHGPVFDGQYAIEKMGHERIFTEPDPANDPLFSKVFNHKPAEELLFQTDPLLVGSLIQSKCLQCHQNSKVLIENAVSSTSDLTTNAQDKLKRLEVAYANEKANFIHILQLKAMINELGYNEALNVLKKKSQDYTLSSIDQEKILSQIHYLEKSAKNKNDEKAKIAVDEQLQQEMIGLLGSASLVKIATEAYLTSGIQGFDQILKEHQADPEARGTLFAKGEILDLNQDVMLHAKDTQQSFETVINDPQLMTAIVSDVDELTRSFQRGQELYLSQACYACHRISGFSRGGVGPELTYAGNLYPWYIKRKMVWPQGDLPTSTMPNMRLDHLELQDLTTFLLAQKGKNKAVAESVYKANLQAWEAGKKQPWEKPLSPSGMYNINESLTIFATQGCAACHRLQGFESDVGFKIEKTDPSFNAVYQDLQWFKKLFPEVVHINLYDEEVPGSNLIEIIAQHAAEIDDRIVSDVRHHSLLEEIEKEHPDLIESFYSPFRYAARAKNDYFQQLINQESDQEKIEQYQLEWREWKDRVHRVLMVYIQTYGFGRLIGPHLNWTGIYRTDEWLMEHFRNPSGHVPRSIMPILPFDDTKFYALTYLLDDLSYKNRNKVREIWSHKGFDPKEAYDIHCAQCHGVSLYGNGVIAEWLYPIPKNLHNAEFLRNLTREKAVYSIMHGVHGTPMPPWGEVAGNKPIAIENASQQKPVLTEGEIRHLVDWLFTSLPGGEVIKNSSDVPKWDYTPNQVMDELGKENGQLISLNDNPPIQLNEKAKTVFEKVNKPSDSGNSSFYINKKYYTPYNIEQGRAFFQINCAYCHGSEADGTGARSSIMQDAKPRMLTNLDWIRSRDDLRLLRSIKFGVPGTAMTPWGDLTSSLQRLQLVIFIRSLTLEKEERERLAERLYLTFDTALVLVENARIEGVKQIDMLQEDKMKIEMKQRAQEINLKDEKTGTQEVLVGLYAQKLQLEQQLDALKNEDLNLSRIYASLKKEKELYSNLGISLIAKNVNPSILEDYLRIVQLNGNRFKINDGHLVYQQTAQDETEIRAVREKIVEDFNSSIMALDKSRLELEGKLSSTNQKEELESNKEAIVALKKLRDKLIQDTEESLRLSQEQKKLLL